MNNSLSYYVTLLVIKLKGIKRQFSQDPIDYKNIRKEDLHEPKGNFFKEHVSNRFKVLETTVTEVGIHKTSQNLLIFIHGGAFISGPGEHHWNAVKAIAKKTGINIWLCDYPKAPETKIKAISENIDAVYQKALEDYNASNICIIGDSVGATLTASLVQRLVGLRKELPKKIILISPVMDASLSHPEIDELESKDPVLSKKGVLSAKKMCAGSVDLKDPMISPIYGSFKHFPPTVMFLAQHDIMYPDEKLAVAKMKEANVTVEVIEGSHMPHIWPLLPVMKEAKMALEDIIKCIKV